MSLTLNEINFEELYVVSGNVRMGARVFPHCTMARVLSWGASFCLTDNGYMFINDNELTIDKW